MLHIEMVCGACDAMFSMDSENDTYEDTAWLLAQRFANAHASSCDYVTEVEFEGIEETVEDVTVRYIKKPDSTEDGE